MKCTLESFQVSRFAFRSHVIATFSFSSLTLHIRSRNFVSFYSIGFVVLATVTYNLDPIKKQRFF